MTDHFKIDINAFHTLVFDFDGVFTDNKVYLNAEGEEFVCCDRRDGLAFDLLRHMQSRGLCPWDVFIVSKEPNAVVLARAKKLKLNCLHGVSHKLQCLKDYFKEHRPQDAHPFEGLIYLGNDLNDLAVMRLAKLSVAPADAHALIKKHATIVRPEKGGECFVRAFLEEALSIDTLAVNELESWF